MHINKCTIYYLVCSYISSNKIKLNRVKCETVQLQYKQQQLHFTYNFIDYCFGCLAESIRYVLKAKAKAKTSIDKF